jgi:hypothetical protein
MAYQQPQQGHWDQNIDMSPLRGAAHDVPPPVPAHRQPISTHADSPLRQMPNQRQYPDPNNYSDYSTPGVTPGSDSLSSGIGLARPMGVPERSHDATPFSDHHAYDQSMPPRAAYSQRSYNSSMHSVTSRPQGVPYSDNPYNRYSSTNLDNATGMGHINPNEVADDDDWGMGPGMGPNAPQNKRRSFLPLGASRGALGPMPLQ